MNNYLEELKKSAIAEEIIKLNFKEITDFDSALGLLLYKLGIEDRTNTGRLRSSWLEKYDFLREGGWWCRGVNLLSENLVPSDWGCFKPYNPRMINGKINKYEQPPRAKPEVFALEVGRGNGAANKIEQNINSSNYISFWQEVRENNRIRLVLTEGAKKAASLLSAGYVAVGISGVDCGYYNDECTKLIPQLECLAASGREIILAFDRDSKYKSRQRTTKAIQVYTKLFEEKGCEVKILYWDSKLGKGIDDLIFTHGEEKLKELFENKLTPQEFLQKVTSKKPSLTFDQLLDFVESDLSEDLRFDELKNQVLFKGKELVFDEGLRAWFLEEFDFIAKTTDLCEVLLYQAKKNSFHPVQEFLKSVVNAEKFIGIDDLSTRYLGTDNELYDLMLKRWLIAAVARAFKPGCQADHTLVLQGAQGIYKSSFFNVLGGNFFDCSATAKFSDKDNKLIIHSCWIEEFGEIERLTRKEQGELKQWFTTRRDNFRKPYDRTTKYHDRSCVFAATCNLESFLNDETGSRRFWVIPVNPKNLPGGKIDIAKLTEERSAIWASATVAYLKGEKWWVEQNEELAIAENNEEFSSYDEWQSRLSKWLLSKEETRIEEILTDCFNLDVALQSQRESTRIGKILTKLGWRQKRVSREGRRIRVYFPPIATEPGQPGQLKAGGREGGREGGRAENSDTAKVVDSPVQPVQPVHPILEKTNNIDLPFQVGEKVRAKIVDLDEGVLYGDFVLTGINPIGGKPTYSVRRESDKKVYWISKEGLSLQKDFASGIELNDKVFAKNYIGDLVEGTVVFIKADQSIRIVCNDKKQIWVWAKDLIVV